jgi:diazepam-binding inhibitor (GABA receptor modulating acyl-CoA-binding protein)
MALADDFKEASERVKNLPKRPDNENLLKLYSLFKQGNEGDVQGARPGFADFEGRAKYDAWSKVKGMSTEDAQQQYVDLVVELEKAQGVTGA